MGDTTRAAVNEYVRLFAERMSQARIFLLLLYYLIGDNICDISLANAISRRRVLRGDVSILIDDLLTQACLCYCSSIYLIYISLDSKVYVLLYRHRISYLSWI